MLTILPVIYLFITALVVFFLRGLKRGIGFAWLASIVMTLIAWAGVLWLHWQDITPLKMTPWRPIDPQAADPIVFVWDEVSWGLGFALVSLVLCLLFTAPARLQHRSSPSTWFLNLILTAFGLAAVLAATPMATVLAWTALDIVELIILIRLIDDARLSGQAVIAFSAKVAGTLVLLWAMVQSYASGNALNYADTQLSLGVFLLLAAGVRLGVLPLNLPYPSSLPLQRGLSNMLRMTTQASGLVVLARLPAGIYSGIWMNVLLVLTGLATLYGSAMWVTAKSEIDSRQYWSLALAGFAVAATLHGNQQAVLTWGMVLIISGGIISFYSARNRSLLFVPILGLIGMVGLPFTPAAAGIAGFAAPPLLIWDLLFFLSLAMLIAGYIRLSLMAGDSFVDLERWVIGVYPPGLIILAVSGWLIAVLSHPGGLSVGVWWASVISFALAFPIFFLLRLIETRELENQIDQNRYVVSVKRISSLISPIMRLSWVYRLLWNIFIGLQRLLDMITRMLEGEGGVLWTVLLVALLLTILAGGGFLQ